MMPTLSANKFWKYSLVLLSWSLLFSSCFNMDDVEIKDIRSFKIVNSTNEGITLGTNLKISNPNYFDIKVIDSDFDLFIKGKRIGSASMVNKITIPSKSEEYHDIELYSDYKNLDEDLITQVMGSALFGSKKVQFKVKGEVTGKVWFFKKRIDLEHEGEVPLNLFK